MRDYDVETCRTPQQFQGDKTQAGYVKDIYGLRKDTDPKDDPKVKPSKLVRATGAQNQKVSKEAQEIIKRSLKVSEDRRRARIGGAAPVNYDSYLNKKPLGSYVPAEEKPIKRGKTGGLLGEFLSKSYYSVNKFPSI